MATIHAYRRVAPISVDVFGQTIEFKPNAKGEVIAEVDDEAVAERLLSIDEAYRELGAPSKPPSKPPSNFIVTNGDETVDLGGMDDEALRAFAAKAEITIHHAAKGDTIRNAIVKALT